MSRLKAFSVPAAFFVGLALICSSLIEFARWPFLVARLPPDIAIDAARARYFLGLAEMSPTQAMSAAAIVGAVGFLLIMLRRRTSGGWLLGLALPIGLIPAAVRGLEYTVFPEGAHRISCGLAPPSSVSELPPLLVHSLTFVLAMSVLIGIAWLVTQRQEGIAPTPEMWIALGASLAMLGFALMYAESARHSMAWLEMREAWAQGGPPPAPRRTTLWIAALTVLGLLLSTRPLYVSRFVSLAVLLLGVSMTVPAIEIAHDETVTAGLGHRGAADEWSDPQPIETFQCEVFERGPTVYLSGAKLLVNDRTLDLHSASLEQDVSKRIVRAAERDRYIMERAGKPPNDLVWNLSFSRDAQLGAAQLVLRSLMRAGVTRVALVHARVENVDTWLQPVIHRHPCGLTITLGETGQPMSEFADWPSLVRAADEAKGRFHLDVR